VLLNLAGKLSGKNADLIGIFAKFRKHPILTLPITGSLDNPGAMEVSTMETLVEQRRERRTDLSWPVSVWLPEADRFFNGRSANISKTGALITVPLSTPAREGSVVELNFPRSDVLAQEKGQYARIKKGRIVRVDRRGTLDNASIGLGIAFE
jgi:hypothetical protein